MGETRRDSGSEESPQLRGDIKYDNDAKHDYSFEESAILMNYDVRREVRREVRCEAARLEVWGALHQT